MHVRFVAILLSLALSIFALPLPGNESQLRSIFSFGKRHLEPLIGLVEHKVARDTIELADSSISVDKRINRGGRGRREVEIDNVVLDTRVNRGGRGRREAEAEAQSSIEALSRRVNRGGRGRRDADPEDVLLETRINRGGRGKRDAEAASITSLGKRINRGGRGQ